ncbi:GAF domain-containing protein [Halorussus litoreus]|uniref:GAF domain-containing protein n=1 Tax=Halorussus litoreus TaxID=1710536 RepID=UPI000E225E66|nr:GAF domain-containing protein [Halorussus litoreus]
MLRAKGDRRRVAAEQFTVVYVGESSRGAAIAEQLSGGTVSTERSAASALDRLDAGDADCVVAEAELSESDEAEAFTVDGAAFLDAVGDLFPAVGRVLLAESVADAPDGVAFVDSRSREDLPRRVARRVERVVERRRLAAERDRLADRFGTLVEGSPDPILTVDEDGVVVFANDAVERVFGHPPDAVVGKPVVRLLDPGVHESFERTLDELAADEGHVQRDYVELAGWDAAGSRIPLAISFSETERGGRHYFSAIVRDVRERKRLEDRLEAEKHKTKELHEVAVMLEECDTVEAVCRLAVETAEQLLEFDIAAVDTVEDGELVPQAVSKGVPSDGYYTTTALDADDKLAARAYRRGETIRTADLQAEGVSPAASGYRAALSVPMADIGVFQAVSKQADAFGESDRELAELLTSHVAQALQRIRSERKLEAERDRFAALFENIREATVSYEFRDGEPVVRSVNGAFESVFGYDADAVVGESLVDLIVPEDERAEARAVVEQMRAGGAIDTEVRREAVDGVRDFLLRTARMPDGDAGGYVMYTDITERKRNEERHRSMTEDVLDETDVGIFVLDDEFDVAWANAAVAEYFRLDREAALGADKPTLIADAIREVVEDGESFAETVLGTYDDNTSVEEFTCHVTPGERRAERHLHHRSRPIESGLYEGGRVELYYDVTERVKREAMLDALHGATRDLMGAESQSEISEIAVETIHEVLDLPHATVFRYDEDADLLDPFVLPSRAATSMRETPCFEPGEGIVGSVFESGTSEQFDNVWDDPRALDDGAKSIRAYAAFPLGDWGVLTVASTEVGAFDDYEIDLARVLAANTEVALDRAAREAELADQRSQLAELDRINAVIRDVDQLLVRATTREEIMQAVCDRLASSDHYRFAWTSESMAGSTRAEPTAWAGVEEGYLDEVVARRDETPDGPGSVALRTGEVQVVGNVREDEMFAPWRDAALERGYRSAAAIPLRYRETVYGVLCVYAARPDAFDDREQAVLAELGETIGHAINAAEKEQALVSDGMVEVEFEIREGEGFFARVPREEGGRFSLDGVTMTGDGSFVFFMTAEGLDPDRVLERAEAADDIERARLVNRHDDGDLFEFVYTGPSPMPQLVEYGGTLADAEFTPDGGRSVVKLPRSVDVRTIVESVRDALPGTKVVARRERERPSRTVEEFRSTLGEDLTERQRSAMEAAYYAGFFEWPRESDGEDVSESLGVSPPTFHEHLRVGERKLLSAFLDD